MKLSHLDLALLTIGAVSLPLAFFRPAVVVASVASFFALAAVEYIRLRDAWKEERVAAIEKLAKESGAAAMKLDKRVAAIEHLVAAERARVAD